MSTRPARAVVGPQDKQVITHYGPSTLLTAAQWPVVLSKFRGPQTSSGPRYFAPPWPPSRRPCMSMPVNECVFVIDSVLKTTKSGKHLTNIRIQALVDNKNLCSLIVSYISLALCRASGPSRTKALNTRFHRTWETFSSQFLHPHEKKPQE